MDAFRLQDVDVSVDDTPILDGVSLGLEAGGRLAIVGPSGSGKSHVLRVINRLTEITGGAVEVLGRSLSEWPVARLRRRVGWVPQHPALTAGRVAEIVEVPAALHIVDRDSWEARLAEALEVAGIDDRLMARRRRELSGGERQRVALARALVCEPEVLLVDEPSASLDGDAATRLLERLIAWADERGCALVLVTHRLEDVETLGGDLAVLQDGAVIASGQAADLIARSGEPDRPDVVRLMTGRSAERS